MITYTNPELVTEVFNDGVAPGRPPVNGYGGKVSTRYRIRYDGRIRRVYAGVYGNGGSCYVVHNGNDEYLDPWTESRMWQK